MTNGDLQQGTKYGIIITLPVENKVLAALNLSLLLHFFVFSFVGQSNKANTFLQDLTFRKKVCGAETGLEHQN
jgi:hypothetical protein